MTVLIISSTEDPASTNIKKSLLGQTSWDEINSFYNNPVYRHQIMKDLIILTINDRMIKHEKLDKEVEEKLKIKPKQAIYISKHRSKTREPTLTTHPIGNYGEAEFGGKTRTLPKSSPRLMTQILRNIKKRKFCNDCIIKKEKKLDFLVVKRWKEIKYIMDTLSKF